MPDNEAKVFLYPFLGVPELIATKKSLATPLLPDSASPKLVLSPPTGNQAYDHTGLFLLKPQVVRHTFVHFRPKSATLPFSPAVHCGLWPFIQPSLTPQ